jgi:hypothetical protein
MSSLKRDMTDKLTILQRHDHFRHWTSLDETRVCVLCDKSFAGREVLVSQERGGYELHCPTSGCHSRVHQWVYPSKPLLSEEAYADWWKALSDPVPNSAQAV